MIDRLSASALKADPAIKKGPYLWRLRPYFRQVAGRLVIGSLAAILMNTAVVLPPVFLGRALDVALALNRHQARVTDLRWAVAAFVAVTLAVEVPRLGKRWWLMVAQSRVGANVRSDAIRGVLGWPMERLAVTPVGDVMARVVGDVQILTVAVGELIVETWDTVLFSLSLAVAMFVLDFRLAALTLLPIPIAVVLASLAGRLVSARTAAGSLLSQLSITHTSTSSSCRPS